jgi:hypothetical protein
MTDTDSIVIFVSKLLCSDTIILPAKPTFNLHYTMFLLHHLIGSSTRACITSITDRSQPAPSAVHAAVWEPGGAPPCEGPGPISIRTAAPRSSPRAAPRARRTAWSCPPNFGGELRRRARWRRGKALLGKPTGGGGRVPLGWSEFRHKNDFPCLISYINPIPLWRVNAAISTSILLAGFQLRIAALYFRCPRWLNLTVFLVLLNYLNKQPSLSIEFSLFHLYSWLCQKKSSRFYNLSTTIVLIHLEDLIIVFCTIWLEFS